MTFDVPFIAIALIVLGLGTAWIALRRSGWSRRPPEGHGLQGHRLIGLKPKRGRRS